MKAEVPSHMQKTATRLAAPSLRSITQFYFLFLVCIPVYSHHIPNVQIRNSNTVPVKFDYEII